MLRSAAQPGWPAVLSTRVETAASQQLSGDSLARDRRRSRQQDSASVDGARKVATRRDHPDTAGAGVRAGTGSWAGLGEGATQTKSNQTVKAAGATAWAQDMRQQIGTPRSCPQLVWWRPGSQEA